MNIDDSLTTLASKEYQPIIINDAVMIEYTLRRYGHAVRVVDIEMKEDDSVEYQLEIAMGEKLDEIESRMREVALVVASPTGKVAFRGPIPGRSLIGITVPYKDANVYKYAIPQPEKVGIKKFFPAISRVLRVLGYTTVALAEHLDPISSKVHALNRIINQKEKNDDSFRSDLRRLNDLAPHALKMLEGQDYISASLLQRRLKIDYFLASKILDVLYKAGYIDKAEGSKPRRILKHA